jgi:hypothetical protein
MLEPTRCCGTRARKVEEYCQRASPLYALGESCHAEYSAVGKAHYRGKDVPEGRSPPRQRLPATVGPAPQKPTFRRGRANKAHADTRHRFRELYRCFAAELLLDGWHDLNKAAASGVAHGTADASAANLQGNIEA